MNHRCFTSIYKVSAYPHAISMVYLYHFIKFVFKSIFQSLHTMYTPALDENHVSWKIVPDIWIWSKVQFPFLGKLQLKPKCSFLFLGKLHFTSYPDVGYNFSADAILIQSRGVHSVQRLEKSVSEHMVDPVSNI